jgi:hypothetical protein
MSKKQINPTALNIRVCMDCGRRIHHKDSNICDACLEIALADTEVTLADSEVTDETNTKQ